MSCRDLVIRLASEQGLKVPDQELATLIENFEKRLTRNKVFSADDLQASFDAAMTEVTGLRIAARRAKIEALTRAAKTKEILGKVDDYMAGTKSKNSAYDAFSAQIIGESRFATGSRDSIAVQKSALELDQLASFELAIRREGGEELLKIHKSGTLDDELISLEADPNAKVSKEARQIFDVSYKHSNGRRQRKNRAGAYINEKENYLVRQSHDMNLIAKAGQKTYVDDILRIFHPDVFEGMSSVEIQQYANDLWKRFSSGNHHLADQDGIVLAPRAGQMNLAKKLSQSRTIKFANAEGAVEYHKKYTQGTVYEQFIRGIEYDARSIVLMEKFGSNPGAVFNGVLDRIHNSEKYQGTKRNELRRKAIEANYTGVNGSMYIPASHGLANISFAWRALESVTKLGGAVLAAFPDLVFKITALNRRTSLGLFGSVRAGLLDFVDGVPAKDKKYVSQLIGVYFEGTSASAHALTGSIDSMPGVAAKIQEAFFKINLLQRWTVNHKEGLARTIASHLANIRKKSWDQLEPNDRRNLELYNITADEWSLMQFAETSIPESEYNFLTAPAVRELSDEAVDSVLRKRDLDITPELRDSFRDQLALKIQTVIHDIADEGVVTPGERERVMLAGGQQKGTRLGETMRFLTQFKAFPLTVITKQLAPQYYAYGGGLKGAAAMAPIIAATGALGYLSGAAKDLAKGKEPKDPRNGRVMIDSLLRGGALGIYGDFMFAEYSRYGRSLEQTIAGPAIGTLSDFAALAHKTGTLNAEMDDYVKFVKSITPGQNLFYTEQILNYFVFNSLIELSDPGYLSRMERRLRKDYNQEYWLPPTTAF